MPNISEVVFTALFDRQVRVSADRQRTTHRAMAWSMDYTPDELIRWVAFYERMAQQPGMVRAGSGAEVSRKHAPPPEADWLTVAKAISWSLHRARETGATPVALVMDPALWALFRNSSGGAWDLHRPSLFDLPVEVDRSAEGWAVRVRSVTSVAEPGAR